MTDKKYTVESKVEHHEDGSSEGSLKITKNPMPLLHIDTAWDMVRIVCSLDRDDPHFELKIANLFKAFGHRAIAHENCMAHFRTEHHCRTPEDYEKFFEKRRKKHSLVADRWFTKETDYWKLKHFYQEYHEHAPDECTPVDTPDGPYEKECRCWEIK
jgi:hypothetical protein